MARAQAQTLRIYEPGSLAGGQPLVFHQSYWQSKRILIDGAVASFQPFSTGVIVSTNTGDNQSLDVTFPATSYWVEQIENAVSSRRIFEVSIFELNGLDAEILERTETSSDIYWVPTEITANLLSRFFGEVVDASSDRVALQVNLGSSLSPVGAQVPSRKFVSSLVGTPLRL